MPEYKVSKDRLTMFLGENTAGDLKLKPKSENPRTLKHCNKQNLLVVWRSNKKAWVTATIFED